MSHSHLKAGKLIFGLNIWKWEKKEEFACWFAHTLFSIQLLIVMSNTLSHCNNAKSDQCLIFMAVPCRTDSGENFKTTPTLSCTRI
jgi:hypothetical protein